MKNVKTPANLTYEEFEVLQHLVRNDGTEQADLPNLVPQLKSSQIRKAVRLLHEKHLATVNSERIGPTEQATEALEPYRVKRAVILAGGLGQRMIPETIKIPKPLVMVNEKRLIETQLDALLAAGITDITIIRGYLKEAFDVLLDRYPFVKFVDSPYFSLDSTLPSVSLVADLLGNAYFLEGDLYINDPSIIRPYEYYSSYCGTAGNTIEDWYFCADTKNVIRQHGHGSTYKFVGIMYWSAKDAGQLKKDLEAILQDPKRSHTFIESIPFDPHSGNYSIITRPISEDAVIEVDTSEELQRLRARLK